jgi:predicted phage terminase large subunit-like protein
VDVHDGPDPLGRRPGEELQSVQGRKLGHFLRLFRVRSSYVWRSVFQQQPVSAEGNLFRRSAFRYWHRMPADTERHGMLGGQRVDCDGGRVVYLDDCWRFATVDLAASTKTSADYTVGAAWAISPDGDLILLDRVRARVSDADHWGLIRPLLGKWALDTVFVEQSFITATFVIDGTAAGVPIQPVTADTDKLTRALPATTRIKAGRVMFPAGADWLDEWCDELAAFPSGTHDDQVDTLSYAARVVAAHWLRADTSSYGTQHRGARADEGVIGSAYEAATGHHPNGMNYMDIPM